MIALLLTCLIIQGSVVIDAGRSSPRPTFEISSNMESFRNISPLQRSDRKTRPSAKSYLVLDVGGMKGKDCSDVEHDANSRTIILIEHQMKRKLNGDDPNGDDDGNSEDVNEDDDSDFEVGEDEINGYDDAVTFREDEEESLRTKSQTKHVGTGGGGGDDDNDNDGADRSGDSLNNRLRKPSFNNDDNRDNMDENDDPDFTDNEEEINNVDDVRDINNSNSITELKSLWRNAITASRIEQQKQNNEEILKAVKQQISENKSTLVTDIDAYQQMPLSTILSQFPALLRANGTDSASFHRQLESQFLDPVAVGNNRAVWMDQEFALVLKGMCCIYRILNVFKTLKIPLFNLLIWFSILRLKYLATEHTVKMMNRKQYTFHGSEFCHLNSVSEAQ